MDNLSRIKEISDKIDNTTKKSGTLFLLRGLPGSGKSSTVKDLGEGSVYEHYEADAYFIKDGKYIWDGTKLKEAHKWCQDKTRDALSRSVPKVFVSNVFAQEWTLKPYYDMAKEYGYKVVSMIIENRHNGKNIHNVPDESIEKMLKDFEYKLR